MEMLLHPILFPAVIAMVCASEYHMKAALGAWSGLHHHLFCLHGCLDPMHVHDNHIREEEMQEERERGAE